MTIVVMPSNASQEQLSCAKLTIPSLPFTVHFPCLHGLPVTLNSRWSFQIGCRIKKWSVQVPMTLGKPPINPLLTAVSPISISMNDTMVIAFQNKEWKTAIIKINATPPACSCVQLWPSVKFGKSVTSLLNLACTETIGETLLQCDHESNRFGVKVKTTS